MLSPHAKHRLSAFHIMHPPLSIDHVVGASLILQHIGQVVELGLHGREANRLACKSKSIITWNSVDLVVRTSVLCVCVVSCP